MGSGAGRCIGRSAHFDFVWLFQYHRCECIGWLVCIVHSLNLYLCYQITDVSRRRPFFKPYSTNNSNSNRDIVAVASGLDSEPASHQQQYDVTLPSPWTICHGLRKYENHGQALFTKQEAPSS